MFSKNTRCSTVSPTAPRPSSRTSAHVFCSPGSAFSEPGMSICCSLRTSARIGSSFHSPSSIAESSCARSSSELGFSASCTSLPMPHAVLALRATSR